MITNTVWKSDIEDGESPGPTDRLRYHCTAPVDCFDDCCGILAVLPTVDRRRAKVPCDMDSLHLCGLRARVSERAGGEEALEYMYPMFKLVMYTRPLNGDEVSGEGEGSPTLGGCGRRRREEHVCLDLRGVWGDPSNCGCTGRRDTMRRRTLRWETRRVPSI